MKKNRILNYVGLIILTIVVLYFSLRNDFDRIVNEILNINPLFLLLTLFLIFSYWFFRAVVLKNFVSKFKNNFKLFDAFRVHMSTIFFDQVTPFASGGQPYQIYKLTKEEKLPVSSSTNIVFQTFIVYQIAFLFLTTLAFLYNLIFRIYPINPVLKSLVTLGFIVNLVVGIIMFSVAFLEKFNNFLIGLGIKILFKLKIIKDKEKQEQKWRENTKQFHDSALFLLKDKKNFIKGILLNILSILSIYIIPIVIFYGLGINGEITGIETLVTAAYVTLMGSYIPLPGGTGGLEYGFLVFFGCFINEPKLTASMIIWRFITYYLGIIIGAIFINIRKKEY